MNPVLYKAIVAESALDALRALGIHETVGHEKRVAEEDWSLEPEAREILLSIVQAIRPRTYLEIGAHAGVTCIAVADLMKRLVYGKVFAIEPEPTLASTIRSAATDENLPLTVIEATSSDAYNKWGREELDVILVDGDHTLSSTTFDIAAWSTLLAKDGWMLIHDTVTRLERRFPGDYIAAPALFAITNIVQVTHRPSDQLWEGLAVMRWSEVGRELHDMRLRMW